MEKKKIIKELAIKYNLTMQQIEDIIDAPFKFQAYIMKNKFSVDKKEFPTVMIPNFGRFYVSEYKQNKLKS